MFHVPCCMLHSVCCIPHTVCSSVPWEQSFLPPPDWVLSIWVPQRRPWNSLKFQAITNASKNHENGRSRRPKASKMVSKMVPETIKLWKLLKKWNLMKTIVFTMFLRGWDIGKLMIFHSKSIKEYGCNVDQHFVTPRHRKYRKVTPNWPQPGHQNPSKI